MSDRALVTNAERIRELDAITEPAERAAVFQEKLRNIDTLLSDPHLRWDDRMALHAAKERLFLQNGASTAVVGCDGVLRGKR